MSQVGDVPRVKLAVQIVASWADNCRRVVRFNLTSSARVLVKANGRILVLPLEVVVRNLVRPRSRAGVELLGVSVLEGVANVDQELARLVYGLIPIR